MNELDKELREVKSKKKKPTKKVIRKEPKVTIGIPTRNRYELLSNLLWSLSEQTYQNFDIVIIDDSDPQYNLTQIPFMFPTIMRLEHQGHSWSSIPGERKGPHISHQKILSMAKTDLIFRIDDDCVLDKDCLKNLVHEINQDPLIGAVGPVIVMPHVKKEHQTQPEKWHSIEQYFGKLIERPNGHVDCYGELQWHYHLNKNIKPTEHLYSSFLYKKSAALGIGGFARDLSEVGHREETDFTYRLHLNRWKMFVVPSAIEWHLHSQVGGIRDENKSTQDPKLLWEADNYRFLMKYHEWWKKGKIRESVDIGQV